jgi:hypothetical protein
MKMKKKTKIRVLKGNQNKDGYTFVVDLDLSSTQNSEVRLINKVEENTGVTDVDNLDKVYKKKKVLTNEDMAKSSKGLKFSNPSQRNHSSVYE